MKQIELHNKIDALIDAGIAVAVPHDVDSVVSANDDARRYFYARADEIWLDWLWKNGFLEVIKKKPDDQARIMYRTPELDYLARVVEKSPEKVADFMLSFDAAASQNL